MIKLKLILLMGVIAAQPSLADRDYWEFLPSYDTYAPLTQSLARQLHVKRVKMRIGNLEQFIGKSWNDMPVLKPTGDALVDVATIRYVSTARPLYRTVKYCLNGIVYTVGLETAGDADSLEPARPLVVETTDPSFRYGELKMGDRLSAADYPELERVAGFGNVYRFGDCPWGVELDRRTDRILRFVRFINWDAQGAQSDFIDSVMIENKIDK